MKRIVKRLIQAGWVSGLAERDASALTARKLHVHFTQKGLAHIAAFKSLHDELGDIPDADRHLLYDYLVLLVFKSLERSGEL